MTETHPFPPFIPEKPEILIMGTFPPQPKRWSCEFYYPNWSNDMWRVMGLIFYNDKDHFCDTALKTYRLDILKPFLSDRHIALSDTGAEAVRLKGNASDKFLDITRPIDIYGFLDRYPTLSRLVTTGEKAASVIAAVTGTEAPAMGEFTEFSYNGRPIRHYRMPSTSRAYPMRLEQKAEMYARIFQES